MTAAIEQGEFRDLRNDHPDGLDEARGMLLKAIDELKAESGLPTSQFVLSGFSQGSMLATDVMLHLPEPPAALAIFSGTLLCEEEWKKLAAAKQSIPILQSHGQQDPILPFQAAVWLKDMLEEAEFPVNFIPFEGYHTIPLPALEQFGEMLGELVG
jgi:phospholipase/carboxylesterase